MGLPRDLVRAVRRLDEPQLRRLLILVRGLLLRSAGPVIEPTDVPGMPTVTYRQEDTRCGRQCEGCPHGPYWYAYWREDGRQRSLYLGRELPGDLARLIAGQADEGARGQAGGQADEGARGQAGGQARGQGEVD